MGYGFVGAIGYINLSSGEVRIEHPDEVFYRRYMGGRNFIAYTLLKEVRGDLDPFDEDNHLIFATGVTTGAPFPGNSRFSVGAKSPLTNGYAESEAGGFWGPMLKYAGFDALVIKGKAPRPVFLWVTDGKVEIRDAKSLWGKTTTETEEGIRRNLQIPQVQIACIGPAGERMVRFASIHHDASRSVNGRLGLGAVMGSKNLKAVAVHGESQNLRLYAPEKVREISRRFANTFRDNAVNKFLYDFGTWGGIVGLNEAGILPTRNYQAGSFDRALAIAGPMRDKAVLKGKRACFACPVGCKKEVELDGELIKGPEYETVASFGSNCGIDKEEIILRANKLCNELGMDTISAGNIIAFAMDCRAHGLFSSADLNGLDLRFGNGEAVLKLLPLIAYREGIGDLLAEGVYRAAKRIGEKAHQLAVHVKGEECAMHEPRGKIGVGLGYAVSPKGGDHIEAEHDECFSTKDSVFLQDLKPLGWEEPVWEGDLSRTKAEQFALLQRVWGIYAVLDMCIFTVAPGRTLKLPDVVELVRACTGWDVDLDELLQVSERGIHLSRLFNLKCGKTAKDDFLPDRFFKPLKCSNAAWAQSGIPRDKFKELLKKYYEIIGWDEYGVPKGEILRKLGIEWALRFSERNIGAGSSNE